MAVIHVVIQVRPLTLTVICKTYRTQFQFIQTPTRVIGMS